jgi:deoxyribonuclease-4
MRNLGCFVSSAGGFENIIKNAQDLNVKTVMIHPSPPQRWRTKPFKKEKIEAYKEAYKTYPLDKLFFHGIYLINLATPKKQNFHLSKLALVHYLNLADELNAESVVFHVGSFKDRKDEEKGYEQIVKGINWILEEADNNSTLSLEVAAGSGRVVGSRFEDLAIIYEGIKQKDRVNFCLDTAHLFGSGYDIKSDLESVIDDMDSILGIKNINAVHFNDSKVELNSKKDRHANLGDGFIGESGLRNFLNHQKLKHLPFIMEVPGLKKKSSAQKQVEILKNWADSIEK